MGPKRVNEPKKYVSKGKERVDREQQTKNQFDPLYLEVKNLETAILLLQCEEKPVLLAAAAALSKFGSKSQENLEVLFDLEIVNNIIPLIKHEDLFTRRFAAKLLAEMISIPNVRNFILESSEYYIPYFIKVVIHENDIFLHEFSLLILAEITKDIFGVAQLLKQSSDVDFLFEKLYSPDPDVKKNTLQIIYNLLQDPLGAEKIIETKDFNLEQVYELFNSPYSEIQTLALDVVTDLVRRNQDEQLQEHFRRTKGLEALLKFLDNIEWLDLHANALLILRFACDNPTTVEQFNDIGGIKQILKYIEDTLHSKFFKQVLDIAVCLSHTSRGRKMLHMYGIIDYLLHTLFGNVQEMYETSCHGIGMMTLYSQAAKDLTTSNCMRNILDVLKNDNLNWSARQAALFALNQLMKCDIKNCEEFLTIQGQNYLLWLMKQTIGKVPVEILVDTVDCLISIARNQELRDIIINTDIIEAMCASFELTCTSMDDFKIACCKALSMMCLEEKGRQEFLKIEGPKRLYNLLCDIKSIPIRNAAAQLIQLLCADPVLANAFVSARFLNYMLNNRSTARIVPSWDTCIEALFDSHLPIKFAFTGRLSLHDITQDGFYVLRRNVCTFPILDDILRFKFCPLEPIYVVNCSEPEDCNQLNFEESKEMINRGVFLSTEIEKLTLDTKFGTLQRDTCLYNYVELFKCKLIANESRNVVSKTTKGFININYVVSRAQMLAKFVSQQMSGPDPLITCVDHQLEIHLKEIKDTIETSVIPLGMLRVGSYFERALLFKVIADRIHLPAALVRGEYGKAWIEIAVPQVRVPVEESKFHAYIDRDTTCPEIVTIYQPLQQYQHKYIDSNLIFEDRASSIFPTKLLKPNFIVDLMDCPGDLIPIDSQRARKYREKKLICDITC